MRVEEEVVIQEEWFHERLSHLLIQFIGLQSLLKADLICIPLPLEEKRFHTGPSFCAFCNISSYLDISNKPFHGCVVMWCPIIR